MEANQSGAQQQAFTIAEILQTKLFIFIIPVLGKFYYDLKVYKFSRQI